MIHRLLSKFPLSEKTRGYSFLGLLFFTLPLHLLANTSSISSTKALYNGNVLVLSGNVDLEHSLGKIHSGAARLEKEEADAPFSSIHLSQGVLISLKTEGEISCESANFDFKSLTGNFFPKNGEKISFSSQLTKTPFSLSSKTAEVEFTKVAEEIKIARIKAKDGVYLQYGPHFVLSADYALYAEEKEIPCISASSHCILSHCEDQVASEKIEFFPQASQAILYSPKGTLKHSIFSENHEIAFSCNHLTWQDSDHSLILQGNIWIKDQELGDIRCDEEIQLQQKQVAGKWILHTITAKGKTQFNYQLPADFPHFLICQGMVKLDHDRLALTLERSPDHPIEYYHDGMKMEADQAQMDYEQEADTFHPKKLLLSGNVCLTTETDAETSRCAIADQFVYFPAEDKIILSSQNGKNVLFWDSQKDLSISANEVHILRSDEGTNIKGVGNVRFAFSTAENAILKKLFPFYKSHGELDESSR